MARTKDEIRVDLEKRAKNNKAKWESMNRVLASADLETDEWCKERMAEHRQVVAKLQSELDSRSKEMGRDVRIYDPPLSLMESLEILNRRDS